ncbi:replication protein A subunit RPA32 [Mycena galericulata]|nr:replication protein A subunit RPA32 [Mycena galericulata]
MSQFGSFGGGGGGFLQGSPGGSQGSPSGAGGKSPASQSLRPVTIAQVHKATQMHSDADWVVDGNAIGQITVVAELQEQRVFTTNRNFVIDDGTGRIDAKMWMDTPEDQKTNTWRGIEYNGPVPVYVRVTGSIKTHNGKRHIHASNIRLVKDLNEVYFHILDVISVHIVLQKGLPSKSGHEQQAGTVPGQSAYAIQSRPTNSPAMFSTMADNVVRYLSSLQPNPEGTFVGDIAKALKADAMELSDCVDRLIDEGHVFTTIDDSHIQLAT